MEEETCENLDCSPIVTNKRIKVNEEASEKDPYIKSEDILSGNCCLLANSQSS